MGRQRDVPFQWSQVRSDIDLRFEPGHVHVSFVCEEFMLTSLAISKNKNDKCSHVCVPPAPSVPLEKGNSEIFRQREARAARLASEIESSPQYRHRVNLENDEGKSEEDKYSAVVREGGDRERGRESPRDRERERGRDSPGAGNRWEAARWTVVLHVLKFGFTTFDLRP